MDRPDSWMPLYIGDYLADTGRLSTEGHGAYLLLIMDYWKAGGPPPDDDVALSNITKLSVTSWRRLRPTLASYFVIVDGKWRHRRLEREISKAQAGYAKRVDAAKKSHEVRRQNRAMQVQSNMQSNSNAHATTTTTTYTLASAAYDGRHSAEGGAVTQENRRQEGSHDGDAPATGRPDWGLIGDDATDHPPATVIPLRRAVGDK
ncbi:DUF1376 domain-containing protein [Azospirillum sp. A26]|uniref:YdaU family protein n=1 Tax=Azospirillum sp. A26 TaxID=3160607 RepID=UPI00366B9257